MAIPFTRTEGHLMFTWCLAEGALKDPNSCDKMKFGDKSLCTGWWYSMLLQAAFESTPERRQQITKWSPEKGLTRNTICSWWIALDTMKDLENFLKELDRWVSRKRRNWVMQLKAEVDKLELRSQLGWMWEKLLLDYFETRCGHHHLPNLWWRTLSHGLRVSYCLRGWFLPEVALEDLNSCDKT